MSEKSAPEPLSRDQRVVLVAGMLAEAGYRSQIVPESPFIKSSASGMKFSVTVDTTDTIQLRLDMKSTEETDVDWVNHFNKNYRFCKIYIDEECDITMESDWVFRPEAPDALSDFKNIIDLWEGSIGLMKTSIAAERERREAMTETGTNA